MPSIDTPIAVLFADGMRQITPRSVALAALSFSTPHPRCPESLFAEMAIANPRKKIVESVKLASAFVTNVTNFDIPDQLPQISWEPPKVASQLLTVEGDNTVQQK